MSTEKSGRLFEAGSVYGTKQYGSTPRELPADRDAEG